MGISDLFSKRAALPEKDRKWNKMWDLWADGRAAAPYAQLMTYESEVNNGGHCQYFDNTAEISDLKAEVDAVLAVLPEPLKGNLQQACEAYLAQEETGDYDASDNVFNACDDVFYANEQLLIALLQGYAETMTL